MKIRDISGVMTDIAPFPAVRVVGNAWKHDTVPDKVSSYGVGYKHMIIPRVLTRVDDNPIVLGGFELVHCNAVEVKEYMNLMERNGKPFMIETAYSMDEFLQLLGEKLVEATYSKSKLTDYVISKEDEGIYNFIANEALSIITEDPFFIMTSILDNPTLIEVR